jgi:NADPH:quinone reductase
MRAATYRSTGPADSVLAIVERERPEPGPGEVRVRVKWSGVNPSDTKARAGTRSTVMPFPDVIPHSDGAGVIDAVGAGVAPGRVGERVWVWNAAWGRPWGTAAEYVALPEAQAVAVPDGTPMDAAACFGIPALTAAHAVLHGGGVSGKRVLVAGGAGAVGHYAVQMARLGGALQVIATVSSAEKGRLAMAAGAHQVIDYRTEDTPGRVAECTDGHGIDRVIEVDFAANAALDFGLLAPEGEVVVYGSSQPEIAVPFVPGILKNLRVQFFIVYHLLPDDRARAISTLTQWLRSDALVHNIAARRRRSDRSASRRDGSCRRPRAVPSSGRFPLAYRSALPARASDVCCSLRRN